MNKIKVAICDDDEFYTIDLKSKIENYAASSLNKTIFDIDIYSSGTDLLNNISNNYDVCFLDICMNEENGIDVGISLKKAIPDTILIFITSFIDFSLDGYKANAFRYILKNSIDLLLPECIDDIIKQLSVESSSIDVNIQGENISIKSKNIVYIESFLHNQIIHLCDDKKLDCNLTLADFEKQLTEQNFVKVHKSYLVNLNYVKNIQNNLAELVNGVTIPIAKHRFSDIKKLYLQFIADL